jgi:acetyl esterase/lipase
MKLSGISLFLASAFFYSMASAELIRDVEYAKPDGVSLKLDVNVPEGKGPFPIAILVHGGGFTNVNQRQYVTPLFAPLTDAKFTWFTINYRGLLSNSYPAWVEDVEQSVRWVKAHGSEYKGDTNRVALIGESFGGYLVSLAVGRATNDSKVNAAVIFYGPFLDMEAIAKKNGHIPPQQMKIYGIQKDEDVLRILHEASVPTYVRPGLPPFLLIHGTADEKAPYAFSVEAQKRLTAVGVPCELISETNAPHGMVNWDKYDQSYKAQMIAWLEKTLGREK